MTTTMVKPSVDLTDESRRPVPELPQWNYVDPELRSVEATARPHEALYRLIVQWAETALKHAYLREIDDPPGIVATVAGLDGVWAHGEDRREAREELLEVLVDWASLKIEHGDDDIPSIDGVSLNISS